MFSSLNSIRSTNVALVYNNKIYGEYANSLEIKSIIKNNNLILFHLGRPNFLIGKGGCKIDELKKELSESFENEIEILIVEDLVSTIPSKYNYTFDYNDYDDYN